LYRLRYAHEHKVLHLNESSLFHVAHKLVLEFADFSHT
jgi:hypothetical protein